MMKEMVVVLISASLEGGCTRGLNLKVLGGVTSTSTGASCWWFWLYVCMYVLSTAPKDKDIGGGR